MLGAEGASGGLEHDLRRALTDFYDPGARTDGNTTQEDPPIAGDVVIRFGVPLGNTRLIAKEASTAS